MGRIKTLYKPFEHWQSKGNIQLFSDPHWDDYDRGYMGYKLSEKEQCDKIIKQIHSNDTLVCLGDVGRPDWLDYIKSKRKHLYLVLVCGNHDKPIEYKYYFDEIYRGPVMIAPKIMLSHEPILTTFYYNYHGHSHEGPAFDYIDGKLIGINLAQNVCEYKVLSLNDHVNGGGLKSIDDIHRQTIDRQTLKKARRLEERG